MTKKKQKYNRKIGKTKQNKGAGMKYKNTKLRNNIKVVN